MKRLLNLILLTVLITSSASAQWHLGDDNRILTQHGGMTIDSLFGLPLRDTSVFMPSASARRIGNMVIRPQDSTVYVYNGARWAKVGSASGSTLDTTSLSNRIDQRATKAYTDSLFKSLRQFNVLDYGAVPNDSTVEFGIAWDAVMAAVVANGGGTIYIPGGFFYTSRAPITTNYRNAQLPLPTLFDNVERLPIRIVGVSGGHYVDGYNGLPTYRGGITYTQKTTTVIVSLLRNNVYNSSLGQASIIGGAPKLLPSPSIYGFSNVFLEFDKIVVRAREDDPTISGVDFGHIAQAVIGNIHVETEVSTPLRQSVPSHPWAVGIIYPLKNNNALCQIGYAFAQGFWAGHILGEHMQANELFAYECNVGLIANPLGHRSQVLGGGVERCPYALASGWDPGSGFTYPNGTELVGDNGLRACDFNLSLENQTANDPVGVFSVKAHVYDPYNSIYGKFRYLVGSPAAIIVDYPGLKIIGGDNLNFENMCYTPRSYQLQHSFSTGDNSNSAGAANTGQPEQQLSGVWGISGGSATVNTSTPGKLYDVWNTGKRDGSISVKTVLNASNRLVFRCKDINNMMFVEVTPTSSALYTVINGVVTPVSVEMVNRTVGSNINILAVTLGSSITYYINNSQIGSYNEITGLETYTKIGIGTNNVSAGFSAGVSFDDLTMIIKEPYASLNSSIVDSTIYSTHTYTASQNYKPTWGISLSQVGNSITYGYGLADLKNRFGQLIANDLNIPLDDRGISGDIAGDIFLRQIAPATVPTLGSSITNRKLFTVQIGTNDVAFHGSVAGYDGLYKELLRSAVSWLAIPREYKRLVGDSGITTTATRGGPLLPGGDTLNFIYGPGSTTIPIKSYGFPIYLWYLINDNVSGSFTLTVDGSVSGVFQTTPTPKINSSNAPGASTIACVRVSVPAGDHNLVINQGTGDLYAIFGAGTMPADTYVGNSTIALGLIPPQNASINDISESDFIRFRLRQTELFTECVSDGMDVRLVNTGAYMKGSDNANFIDHVHPSVVGHQRLYEAYRAGFKAVPGPLPIKANLIGNVGIGTTAPDTKLTVSGGDIRNTNAGSGLILQTPDGTKKYRIAIDNAGNITTTLVP